MPLVTPARIYSDKPSPQKVEEIILLAMKKTGSLGQTVTTAIQPQPPPALRTLIPVAQVEDGNNNLKTQTLQVHQAAGNVISLVLDVNQNGNRNINLLEPNPHSHPMEEVDEMGEATVTGKKGGGVMAGRRKEPGEPPRKESRLLHYCHICNKGFKDRYSVNVHVRTHTGEKPFSCPLCGKCFRQKAHLAKHHQTHAAKQQTTAAAAAPCHLHPLSEPGILATPTPLSRYQAQDN